MGFRIRMPFRPPPRPFPYPLHIGVDICHIQRFRDILFRKPLEAARDAFRRDAIRNMPGPAGHNGSRSTTDDLSRLMFGNSRRRPSPPRLSSLGATKDSEGDGIQRFHDILFEKPLEAAWDPHRDALRDKHRRGEPNGSRAATVDLSGLTFGNSERPPSPTRSSFLGATKYSDSDGSVDTLEPIDWTLHDEMRALDPPPAEPLDPLNSSASVSELLGPYPLLRRFMTRIEQTHFCTVFGRDLRESAERAKQRLDPTPVSEVRIARRAASMWAVKEAAIKAVKPRRILMRDVDVYMRDLDKASYGNGAPYAVVRARREGEAGQVVRVSLSHDADFAVACVLAVEDMGGGMGTRHVGWETAAREEEMEAMKEMGGVEEETDEEAERERGIRRIAHDWEKVSKS